MNIEKSTSIKFQLGCKLVQIFGKDEDGDYGFNIREENETFDEDETFYLHKNDFENLVNELIALTHE